jgi:hypothetical protein
MRAPNAPFRSLPRWAGPLLLLLLGCGGGRTLLTLSGEAVLVDPGQIFRVVVRDYARTDTFEPEVGTLPDGFRLQSQEGRSLVFRASIHPGVYELPYRLVRKTPGRTEVVSETGAIVVTVMAPHVTPTVTCEGPRIRLTLSFARNSESDTVSTGAFVTAIDGAPIGATLRRKSKAGAYHPRTFSVLFDERAITRLGLGTVSTADFAAYPVLEFTVSSIAGAPTTDPAENWECSLAP